MYGPYNEPDELEQTPFAADLRALREQTDEHDTSVEYGLRVAYLIAACETAGVTLGRIDRRVLLSFASHASDRLITVITGLIHRAHAGNRYEP